MKYYCTYKQTKILNTVVSGFLERLDPGKTSINTLNYPGLKYITLILDRNRKVEWVGYLPTKTSDGNSSKYWLRKKNYKRLKFSDFILIIMENR